MVTAGHLDTVDATLHDDDLVRHVLGKLISKLRADVMTKKKEKWGDILAAEDTVRTLVGVFASKLTPTPSQIV
jgi:hypothetical protein